MWSSAASLSVASLSLKLLNPTSPDRRASHSSLKGLTPHPPFLFVSCQRRNSRTLSPARPCGSWPLPQQPTGGLSLGWVSSCLYPWFYALRSVWPKTHGYKYANTTTYMYTHVLNVHLLYTHTGHTKMRTSFSYITAVYDSLGLCIKLLRQTVNFANICTYNYRNSKSWLQK